MSLADTLEADRGARKVEPLLGEAGNARREAVLERVGAELAKNGNGRNAQALSLLGIMRPNSTAVAWDSLYFELARAGENALADVVANECQQVRAEAWRSMRSDADVISQVTPIGNELLVAQSSGIDMFRRKLESMAGHMDRSLLPGHEMCDYVVDMARFGSGVDDRAVRAVVEELYLERGMFGEACGVCERMIGFEGYDRHRMMASTLIEDVLGAVLDHLRRCGEPGHVDTVIGSGMPISPECKEAGHLEGLKSECLRLLAARAGSLGLGIRPGPEGGDLLRAGFDFAQKIAARGAG